MATINSRIKAYIDGDAISRTRGPTELALLMEALEVIEYLEGELRDCDARNNEAQSWLNKP